MANNRLVALNNLTSQYNEYQKLSDGTTIGVNVLEDLMKYIELELKIKYKIEPKKWKITHGVGKFDLDNYSVIKSYGSDNLKGEYEAHREKLDNINKEYKVLQIKHKKTEADKLKEAELKEKIYEKKNFIELNKDLSSIVKFDSIIELDNSGKKIYFTPSKILNTNNEEIAKLKDDKYKLDSIFKKKHYGSFDSLVIIDFYKELSTKLNKIKKLLAEKDEDIKKYTIEDIYKKLYLLYDIKSVNLKGEDDKDIKEKYIQDKMSKQNTQNLLNVSQVGGAGDTFNIINYNFDLNENKYSFLGAQKSDLSNDYIYFKKYTHNTNSEYRVEPLLIKPLYGNICNNGKECDMKYVRSIIDKKDYKQFGFNDLQVNDQSRSNHKKIFDFFLQKTTTKLNDMVSQTILEKDTGKTIGEIVNEDIYEYKKDDNEYVKGSYFNYIQTANIRTFWRRNKAFFNRGKHVNINWNWLLLLFGQQYVKIKLKFKINEFEKNIYILGNINSVIGNIKKRITSDERDKWYFSDKDDERYISLDWTTQNKLAKPGISVTTREVYRTNIKIFKELIIQNMFKETIYIDKIKKNIFNHTGTDEKYCFNIEINEDNNSLHTTEKIDTINYTYFPITKKENDTTYTSEKIEDKWSLRNVINNNSKQIAIVCDDKFMEQFCEKLKTHKLDNLDDDTIISSIFDVDNRGDATAEIKTEIINKLKSTIKFSIYLHNNLLLDYDNSEDGKNLFKLNYIGSSEVNETIIYPQDIVRADSITDQEKNIIFGRSANYENAVKKIYKTLVPYVLEKICSKDVIMNYNGDYNLVNLHYNNYIMIYDNFYYYPNIPTIVKNDSGAEFKKCFFIEQKKSGDDTPFTQSYMFIYYDKIDLAHGANYALAKIVNHIYSHFSTTPLTAEKFVEELNEKVSLNELQKFIKGKIKDLALDTRYIKDLFDILNTDNRDEIEKKVLIKKINQIQYSFYDLIMTIAKVNKDAYNSPDDELGFYNFSENSDTMLLSNLHSSITREYTKLPQNIDYLFYILSVDKETIKIDKWKNAMKDADEMNNKYNNALGKIIKKLRELEPDDNKWYGIFDEDNDNYINLDDITTKLSELEIKLTDFEIGVLWLRLTRGHIYVKKYHWNKQFDVTSQSSLVPEAQSVPSQAIGKISYHIFYSKDIECYILIKENSNEIITIEPFSKWKKINSRPGNDKKKINSEGFKERFKSGEPSYEITQKDLRKYNINNLYDNHYIEIDAKIYYEREINMKENLKNKISEIYNKYKESNDDKLLTKYSDTINLFNIYMLKDLTSDYKINIILYNKPEKYIYDQLIKNDEAKLIHIFDNNKIQNDGYRKLINEYMDNPSTLTESLDIDEKKKKEIDKELDIELDKDLKLLSADIKDEKEVSKKSYDKLVSKDHMALLKYFNRIKKFKGGADAAKPAAKPSKPTAPAAKPSKPTAPATKPAVQPSRPSNKLLTKVSDEEQIIKEENIIDTYKKLKEVYINIVTKYYNLVQKDGEEDDLLGEIFKDENFSNKSDESNNTNLETQCGIINKFIYEAYNKIQSVNITGFDQVQKTYSDKEKTSIEELRNTLNNALHKQLSIGVDRGKNNKLDTNTINIKLSGFKIFDNTNSKSQPTSLTHHDYLKNILEKKIGASDVNILNHDARVNGAEDIIIINKLRTSKYREADKGTIENAGLDKEDKIEFNIDIFEGKTDEEMKGKDNYNPKYKVNMDAFLKKVDDRIKKIKANNKETKQSTEDKKLSIEDKAYAKAKSRKIFQILLDELANLEKAKTIYKVNEKKIKFHIKQIQARKGEDKEGLYEDIELNDKITDIEARIKLLTDILAELPKLFIKLYRNITKLSKIPQATEYEEYVNYILKYYNIGLFDSDSDNKHKQNSIIKAIVNEKASLEELLKKKKKELETRKEDQKTNSERYLRLRERERYRDRNDRDLVYRGGYKYYGGDYDFDRNFEKIHSTFKNFIALSDNQNLTNLMKQMHENLGYLEESKKNALGETLSNIGTNVYETIWSDYNSGILKRETIADKKYLNNFITLTEGENLHDKVDIYNLNPEKVLAINFRDKSIYIFLMFLIRTISVVTIEFLIDYNIVKTLHYSIIIYGTIYLAILASFIGVVNYDSYKFRIIFNYLNFHVNSSNILLQIVLFIIFIILVFIIVRTDDFVDNINSLLDYTQIYATLVDVADNVTNDYDDNLSESEKLKLKYRMDIVSMIVLIFTSILVLIL